MSQKVYYAPDRERKSDVLLCGMYQDYLECRIALYRGFYRMPIPKFVRYTFDEALIHDEIMKKVNPAEWKECQRLYDSKRQRVKTLNKKVKSIVSGTSLFCTLTFKDEYLSTLSAKTRRRYVGAWLRSCGCVAGIANIDFGSQNDREHYHALIAADSVDFSSWKYGNINVERVRLSPDGSSPVKLAEYVGKLTLHALKESTANHRVIYSGDFHKAKLRKIA